MPDQTLMNALMDLLDIYTQRSRATGNLIAGLKGVNSAINKTNRTLGEYANQNMNLDEALLAQSACCCCCCRTVIFYCCNCSHSPVNTIWTAARIAAILLRRRQLRSEVFLSAAAATNPFPRVPQLQQQQQ